MKVKVDIYIAQSEHVKYAEAISQQVYESAQARGTGIAKRSPEYIAKKIVEGKAVIAIADDGNFAGFSYIESWGHSEFVANSGLIVAPKYRNTGLARAIKYRIFNLSRTLYPDAKVFSITTGLAVMKLNSELGYRPVTFAQLTTDEEFWAGCNGCKNIDILKRNDYRMCLCTALLYDPVTHNQDSNTISAVPMVTQVSIGEDA